MIEDTNVLFMLYLITTQNTIKCTTAVSKLSCHFQASIQTIDKQILY